jgi:hypothetical protein
LLRADPQETDVLLASVHTLVLADAGEHREAERRINEKILPLAESMKPYGHFHHVANFVADIYAQLNKPEQAGHGWRKHLRPASPAIHSSNTTAPLTRSGSMHAMLRSCRR